MHHVEDDIGIYIVKQMNRIGSRNLTLPLHLNHIRKHLRLAALNLTFRIESAVVISQSEQKRQLSR